MNAPTGPSGADLARAVLDDHAERRERTRASIGARWDRMDARDRDVIGRAAGLGLGRYTCPWRELREGEQRAVARGAMRCARIARELLETP